MRGAGCDRRYHPIRMLEHPGSDVTETSTLIAHPFGTPFLHTLLAHPFAHPFCTPFCTPFLHTLFAHPFAHPFCTPFCTPECTNQKTGRGSNRNWDGWSNQKTGSIPTGVAGPIRRLDSSHGGGWSNQKTGFIPRGVAGPIRKMKPHAPIQYVSHFGNYTIALSKKT